MITDAETLFEAEGIGPMGEPCGLFGAMPSGMVFVLAGKDVNMETRIGAVSIIVEEPEAVEALNAVLHEFAGYILGRMGIPYRQKGVNIICIAVDAPIDVINAMTGKIGRLPGVSAKAVCSRSSSAQG